MLTKLEKAAAAAGAALLAICALSGERMEASLRFYPKDGILSRSWESGTFQRTNFRPAEEVARGKPRRAAVRPQPPSQQRQQITDTRSKTWQKINTEDGQINAEYGFLNFNNDSLRVSFSIAEDSLSAYSRGYGYSDAELKAIRNWYETELHNAYQYAVKNKHSQKQLDAASAAIEADYKGRQQNLWTERGFRLQRGNVLSADIPAIVRRNVKNMRPVAISLNDIADKMDYDPETLVAASLAMVQTAIEYKIPPDVTAGKHTGGILPPMEAMSRGWGDCDTKTALLASILSNWDGIRLIGVSIPRHYLMAVMRSPGKGDLFVEYKGLQYVLLEPAGPAWLPPGKVGESTLEFIKSSDGFALEPLNF